VSAARRSAAALLAVSLAGCVAPVPLDGPAVSERPAPVPDWIAQRYGQADDGRRVELAPGASLAIALRAPGAAGAGWIVTWMPSHLALVGRSSGPVWPAGAPGAAVATPPVWQVFVVEARAPGEGTVDLELRAADGAVLRRFVLRVAAGSR
jgi:hypothetical protein